MLENKDILIQGSPPSMVQQLADLEAEGWEVRLVLDRPLFGNRMTIWAQRELPDPIPSPPPSAAPEAP